MKCENCGEEHDGSYGSGRFCSMYCAKGFSTKEKRQEINKKISISLGGTGEKIINKCLCCGKETENKKFCSVRCHKKYEKEEFSKKLKSSNNTFTDAQGRRVKKHLIEDRGHKCENCKNTEWQNQPIPLILDHIDGNSYNWNLDNLRLICPNCDHQSSTFGARNYGKGRKLRKKQQLEKYYFIKSINDEMAEMDR